MPLPARILANYVYLEPGKPKRLVLTNPRIVEYAIRDPKTKMTKTVRALEWDVLEEDGAPTKKTFRVLSEKLAQQLMTLWEHRTGDKICVVITMWGEDLAKDYEVRPC
ncbi:hypothetical protein DRJ17_07600 [Candidatus Woesearchaeota archaeon]|nr:MAG: hypothetical protein DRJ17_07600 [Candidatus Woesearchaeota archaeon]